MADRKLVKVKKIKRMDGRGNRGPRSEKHKHICSAMMWMYNIKHRPHLKAVEKNQLRFLLKNPMFNEESKKKWRISIIKGKMIKDVPRE